MANLLWKVVDTVCCLWLLEICFQAWSPRDPSLSWDVLRSQIPQDGKSMLLLFLFLASLSLDSSRSIKSSSECGFLAFVFPGWNCPIGSGVRWWRVTLGVDGVKFNFLLCLNKNLSLRDCDNCKTDFHLSGLACNPPVFISILVCKTSIQMHSSNSWLLLFYLFTFVLFSISWFWFLYILLSKNLRFENFRYKTRQMLYYVWKK